MHRFRALVATLICLGLQAIGAESQAFQDGISSSQFLNRNPANCSDCHGGGATPAVDLSADATVVQAGATLLLTFTVTTNNGNPGAAGFNLRASIPGTFDLGGPESDNIRILNVGNATEATHSSPKQGEPATFTVTWTAPEDAESATITFTAWGNAVNFDGDTGGDAPFTTTLDVVLDGCIPTLWYRDADGDTHGAAMSDPVSACAAPQGFVASNDDCDDTDEAVSPDVLELCNEQDDDCDGQIDEDAGCVDPTPVGGAGGSAGSGTGFGGTGAGSDSGAGSDTGAGFGGTGAGDDGEVEIPPTTSPEPGQGGSLALPTPTPTTTPSPLPTPVVGVPVITFPGDESGGCSLGGSPRSSATGLALGWVGVCLLLRRKRRS